MAEGMTPGVVGVVERGFRSLALAPAPACGIRGNLAAEGLRSHATTEGGPVDSRAKAMQAAGRGSHPGRGWPSAGGFVYGEPRRGTVAVLRGCGASSARRRRTLGSEHGRARLVRRTHVADRRQVAGVEQERLDGLISRSLRVQLPAPLPAIRVRGF